MAATLTLPEPTAIAGPARALAGIAGLGTCLPSEIVDNDTVALGLDTSDEWIRERTGITSRRRVAAGVATSDLAVEAGAAALLDGGWDVSELSAVIVATTSPDRVMPATAPEVASRLGAGTGVAAFDVGAACSGFVHALRVATGLVATGDGPVLVIGAETMTRITDPTDRTTAPLFGDGAGAVVISVDGPGRLRAFDLGAEGVHGDLLCVPAGGTRSPATSATVAAHEHTISMRGREVYRHAVQRMVASSTTSLERAGLVAADVDVLVAHQANVRILNAVAQRLGVPTERCVTSIAHHGNTSAASIPLALADARDAGLLHDGAEVLLTSFGAGFTWGSCVLTWGTAPSDQEHHRG